MKMQSVFKWGRRHPVSDADLSAFLDGPLRSKARDHVAAHLQTCLACQARLSEIEEVRAAVRSIPRPVAPRSFAIQRSVGAVRARPKGMGWPAPYAFAPAAALTF